MPSFSFWQALNPARHVIETPNHPHARTLREGLRTKIIDTFLTWLFEIKNAHCFVVGQDKVPRPGIFDYVTCGVPFLVGLIQIGFIELTRWGSPLFLVFSVPFGLVSFALNVIVRFVFAAIATVASLPFIFIAQAISWCIARSMKKTAMDLTFFEGNEKLGSFLQANNFSLQNIHDFEFQGDDRDSQEMFIVFSFKTQAEPPVAGKYPQNNVPPNINDFFAVQIDGKNAMDQNNGRPRCYDSCKKRILKDNSNLEPIKAFYKLNIGNIAKYGEPKNKAAGLPGLGVHAN